MRDWKIVAHVGNHKSLKSNGRGARICFPHIHVNCDNVNHDRTYRTSHGDIELTRPHTITVNEVGDQNGTGIKDGQEPFDELALLLAAAPDLYDACKVVRATVEAHCGKAMLKVVDAALAKADGK